MMATDEQPPPSPPADAAPAPPQTPVSLTKADKARWPSGFSTLRDLLSFLLGLAIIINEVWFAETAEAALIGVGVALAGLPVVLGADERKAK